MSSPSNQRNLRWPSELDAFRWQKSSVWIPKPGDTLLWHLHCSMTNMGHQHEGNSVSSSNIHSFHRMTAKMPGNANMLKHTLISKLFTYCDIQTYRDIQACEYWLLVSSVGVTQKKTTLISDKRRHYSVQYDDSCECGDICVLLILKKAPEAYGECHRLGNYRTVISSLGPVGGFPYSLGWVVFVFCSFSLSLIFMWSCLFIL